MELGEKINLLRKEKRYTMQNLADRANLTKGYISMLEKGKNPQTGKPIIPSLETIQNIAKALNTDLDTLLKDTESQVELPPIPTTLTLINETASKLNEDRQENVLAYTEKQLEEQEQHSPINHIEEAPSLYAVNVVEKLSAGLGHTYQEQNQTHTVYTDRDDLKRYDLASAVTGDSMEPRYSNGDIVLIQAGYDNVNGGVYAVGYDGETFLKRVYFEGDRIRLVSFNRDYKDIYIYLPIEDGTYLNIVGKVVDSFTPIQP